MTLVLSAVKGQRNDQGAFVAPENVPFDEIIKGTDAEHVQLDGLQPGDTIADGAYFVGKFNVEENKFVSKLVPVQSFTVDGEPVVNSVHIEQNDGKVELVAE